MEPAREVPLKESSTDNVLRGFSLHTQCNITQVMVTIRFKNESTNKNDKSDISYQSAVRTMARKVSSRVSARANAPKNLLRENLMNVKVITIWRSDLWTLELFRAGAHL